MLLDFRCRAVNLCGWIIVRDVLPVNLLPVRKSHACAELRALMNILSSSQVAYLLGLTFDGFRRLASGKTGRRKLTLPQRPTGVRSYLFFPQDVVLVRAEYLQLELKEPYTALSELRKNAEGYAAAVAAGRGAAASRRELALLKQLAMAVPHGTTGYCVLQVVIARHERTPLPNEVDEVIRATNSLDNLGLARRAIAILRDEIDTCNMLAADLERLEAGAADVPPAMLTRYKLHKRCRSFADLKKHRRLLELCREAVSKRGRLYGSLALSLESTSAFSFAQQASEDALRLARQHGDKRTEAIATKHAGDLARIQGRQEAAIVHYHKALELYGKINFPPHKVHSGLGLAAWELARTGEARQWFETALEAYTTTHTSDIAGTATARLNLGSLLFTTGEIHKARSHFEEAVSLSLSDGGRLHTQVIARINLGNCLEVIGNNENAIREYLQACSLAERMHNVWLASYARMLAADLQQSDIMVNVKHEIEQAQNAIQRKMADHWTVPFVLLKRARICMKSKDFNHADELLRVALTTAEQVGMPAFRLVDIHIAMACLNLYDEPDRVEEQVKLAEEAWTKFKGAHQEIMIRVVRFCLARQGAHNPNKLKPQLDYLEGLVNKLNLLPTSGFARAVAFCRHVLESPQGHEVAADPLLGWGRRW